VRRLVAAFVQVIAGVMAIEEESDKSPHSKVLRRLKMCFGRELLIFTDSLEISEGAVLRVEL
jgi:hypothetical protein